MKKHLLYAISNFKKNIFFFATILNKKRLNKTFFFIHTKVFIKMRDEWQSNENNAYCNCKVYFDYGTYEESSI